MHNGKVQCYNEIMPTTTRTRLTTDQTMHGLACLARGDTLSQAAASLLEHYELTVSESALSQMRKKHAATIEKMRDTVAEATAMDADAILHKARRQLSKKLDRADRDDNELQELDRKYREGEIKDPKEYRRRKAGLLRLSISELNQISRTMFGQAAPALPPGDVPPVIPAHGSANPAQLEHLLKNIKSGDTVELQRILFSAK